MAKESKPVETAAGSGLLITRVFDAPVKLVWQAWSEPKHMMKWWAPKNFTTPHCKIDFRVGGKYHSCMRSAEGQEFWSTGVYREIVPMKRIVCTDGFADEKGNRVSGAVYGMPGLPEEMMITVIFEDINGRTKLTLQHDGIPVGEDSAQASVGWNESLDKLAAMLK